MESNPSYDQKIAKAWEEKVTLAKQNNIRIWDGTYYGVTNVSEVEDDKLILRLGTVPFRYIGTISNLKEEFIKNNFEPLFHLSTAAIIRTTDNSCIFGKRSNNGTIDLIGGGVQQDEIEIKTGIDLEKNLLKEIAEETGIQESQIKSIEGIGIVQSITSNVIIISLVQLRLSDQEVKEAFKQRTEDEMSELIFVPQGEIKSFLRGMTSYRPLIADLLDNVQVNIINIVNVPE